MADASARVFWSPRLIRTADSATVAGTFIAARVLASACFFDEQALVVEVQEETP